MLSKKVILPTLALVSVGNAIVQDQVTDLSNCRGSFSEQVNFLYLNCYDNSGNLVERYQRLFTRPLEKVYREVPRSSLTVPPTQTPVTPVTNETEPVNGTDNGTNNGTDNGTSVDNGTSGNNGTSNGTNNGTSVDNGTTPVDNSSTPVDNSSTPVDNSSTPVDNSSTPVDNTTTPVSNGTSVDNGTAPVDNTTGNSSAPVDNSTQPDNGTNVDNGTNNGTSNETDGGVTTAVQVNCWDYYQKGAGYEFSVCDQGIGAIIVRDRVGSAEDRQWAAQRPGADLGPIWVDLGHLVDNYCDTRANQTNATAPVDGGAVWRSLDLPWDEWRNDALNNFADVGVWLSRYTQYVNQAQDYVNNNPGATLPPAVSEQNPTNVDVSNISYGQLVTEYKNVYQSFIEWYNLFFGVDGLVAVNQREVMDGSVPVLEFSGNITSFEQGEGAATFAVENPFDLQYQLSAIGEWISTKFGSVILENSCNLCNSQQVNNTNGTQPTNGTDNESNSTNGTDGGNGTDNGTTPVDNSSNDTNGTEGGNGTDNGTTPVENGTAPVANESTPVVNESAPVETTPVETVPVETTPGPQP